MSRILRLPVLVLALLLPMVLLSCEHDGAIAPHGDQPGTIDPNGGTTSPEGSSTDNSDARGTIDPNGLKMAGEHRDTFDLDGRA